VVLQLGLAELLSEVVEQTVRRCLEEGEPLSEAQTRALLAACLAVLRSA
jgi:hypothetical protein